MLPHSDDDPTALAELPIGVSVSLAVARNLAWPVPEIRGWHSSAVHRAPVPEAAVHEDCYAARAENDVGPSPKANHRADIHSIPEPKRMKLSPNGELAAGITRPLSLHLCAYPGAACPRATGLPVWSSPAWARKR